MRRIFMISSQLMFSRGVENLLRGQANLEILGRETDAAKAVLQIRELQPDVVILDSKDLASAPSSIIANILKEAPGVKVITLNLANELIRIYHGEQRTAQCIDDLVDVIEEDAPESGSISLQEWTTLAAGRAQVYGFLARIYNGSIDEKFLENLKASSTSMISSLDQGEDLTGDLSEWAHSLDYFQEELSRRSNLAVKDELIEEYKRLFLECSSEGNFIHASESTFASINVQCIAPIREVLKKIYAESGLDLAFTAFREPDYIGSEFEFMEQLCSKEGVAWKDLDRQEALKIQETECDFLRNHLIRWVPRFSDVLLMQTQLVFFRGIACLTKGFILNEAYRVAKLMEWNGLMDGTPGDD